MSTEELEDLKNLKLLIVEDETKLSKLLKEAMSDYFETIILANNGEEGIKKFKINKPDIIITDIMMPKMDGLEMTTEVKKIDEDIPIVILSAFSDTAKLLKAIDLGISKYFIKPFDPDDLVEYLSTLAQKINKKKSIVLKEGFVFNNTKNSLYKDNVLVSLTKREKEFFYILIKRHNCVVLIDEIKTLLWGELVSDERLRTFIKRIRIKTSKDLIENASGQGYLISKNNI